MEGHTINTIEVDGRILIVDVSVNRATFFLLLFSWIIVGARLFVRIRDKTKGVDDLLMAIGLVSGSNTPHLKCSYKLKPNPVLQLCFTVACVFTFKANIAGGLSREAEALTIFSTPDEVKAASDSRLVSLTLQS
jgi:hypothetical protein